MSSVEKAFLDYPAVKLEDKCACYYSGLRSIMHELGGSDYKQAHSGGQKRRRETGTSVDLSINLKVDAYDRCVAYLSA